MNATEAVTAWNAAHPIGTVVIVRRDNNDLLNTQTKSEAFVARNGQAVIFVFGISGYYLLDRLTARKEVIA